ncbi:MAG: hypothetical protein R3247_00010 [Rhodothermales bacterium]|nr:hypothetical protein [Rhodothermales bacterium]
MTDPDASFPDAPQPDPPGPAGAPTPAQGGRRGGLLQRLFGPEDERDLTPLEIRTRLLDAVVRTLEPYRGSAVPFNRLVVHVLAPIQQDRARYEAAVGEMEPRFDVAVRQRLTEAGFSLPKGLPVEHAVYSEAPEALRPAFDKYGPLYVEPKTTAPETHARLEIRRGRAERQTYEIGGARRVNVGRMQQVADERTRVFRRNDVAFLDPSDGTLSDDERAVNQTISREHAHLTFDAQAGHFLWHNEKGSTAINRDSYARPMPVGAQPVPLEDGDELYLGQACVVFRLGRADGGPPGTDAPPS